mgnify:CR=1 FL=1
MLQLLAAGKQRVDQWHIIGKDGALTQGGEGRTVATAQRLRECAVGLESTVVAFDGDKAVRRRSIKNLSFFPPFRGLVRFLYMYFVRLAILDGSAGFHYAAMISMYEYWIELKLREQQRNWRVRTDELALRMLEERP